MTDQVMRKFYTLLAREVRSYFYSPIAYIVLVFFLFVSGADFCFQLSIMNQHPLAYSVQEAPVHPAQYQGVSFTTGKTEYYPIPQQQIDAENSGGKVVLKQIPKLEGVSTVFCQSSWGCAAN